MSDYDHKTIEPKWQAKWAKDKLYEPDIKKANNKFYNLWMFPYPSAEGMHAGHAFASTASVAYIVLPAYFRDPAALPESFQKSR